MKVVTYDTRDRWAGGCRLPPIWFPRVTSVWQITALMDCRANANFEGKVFLRLENKVQRRADSRGCLEVFNPAFNVRIHRQPIIGIVFRRRKRSHFIRYQLDSCFIFTSVRTSKDRIGDQYRMVENQYLSCWQTQYRSIIDRRARKPYIRNYFPFKCIV